MVPMPPLAVLSSKKAGRQPTVRVQGLSHLNGRRFARSTRLFHKAPSARGADTGHFEEVTMSIRSLPARPSLQHDKKEAKRLLRAIKNSEAAALERLAAHHPRYRNARDIRPSELKLADALLVLAREYGVPSWPRYKQLALTLLSDSAERAASLTRALCSNQVSRGLALLAHEPALATFDFYAACATGEVTFVEHALEKDPGLATRAGGPNRWQPLTYVCFSRLWRRDAERAQRLLSTARLLLARGADPNSHYFEEHEGVPGSEPAQFPHPQTCLFAAAGIANHAELTRLLLEAGADVDEAVTPEAKKKEPPASSEDLGAWGKIHPMEALYHASEFKDVACLRLLLQAKPMPTSVSYCLGRALDYDNEEAALLYLEHGADPSQVVPWDRHRSKLHKAVLHRRSLRVIRTMLERGANPNLADDDGLSPYRHAVRRRETAIAALLEEYGADPSRLTDEDRAATPDPDLLVRAARRGDVAEIAKLLDAGANVNAAVAVPPLHSACYAGQEAAAHLLVQRGASLTQRNAFGGTPLGTCIYGSADCFDEQGGPGARPPDEVPARDYAELTAWLIERGSALPESIWGGSEAVQEVLRQCGVPDVEPSIRAKKPG